MPIKVTCPKCQGVLHAPDDSGGKRGKCPTCGTVLAIPAGGSSVGPVPVTGTPSTVPAGGGKPLGEAQGYGLLPPGAGEVRQSSVPMLPRPGEAAKSPAAGFGSPPAARQPAGGFSRPAAIPVDAGATEVRGYRRARRGLGLVQAGQFFLLLAGLAGPGVAIGRLYGAVKVDKDPGFLGKPGLPAVTEIEYAAVLIPLVIGLLLLLIGRVGFGNLPRSSFARGPARLGGLFALLAVMGLVTAGAMAANSFLSGMKPVVWKTTDDGHVLPTANLLPVDELTGKLQLGGLLAFVVFLVLAEVFFVTAVGRLAAGLHHPTAASRHTRFLLLTHLLLATAVGVLALNVVDPDRYLTMPQAVKTDLVYKLNYEGLFTQGWNAAVTHADELLAKAGAARPVVVLGLMAMPVLVVWFLYARLVGGGRRAIGDWLAAHDG